jgi:hypothetical protein
MQRFVEQALSAHGAVVRRDRDGATEALVDEVPRALREALGDCVLDDAVVTHPTGRGVLVSHLVGRAAVAAYAERVGKEHDGLHYVSLLKNSPGTAAGKKLDGAGKAGERAVVRGRGVHLLLGKDYHSAKLSNAVVEEHLGVATNRNLTVIKALAQKWC